MMPSGLSAVIGFFIAILTFVVAVALGLLLPAGSGKQVYFAIVPIAVSLFMMWCVGAIRKRVHWTPNPNRDQPLNDWSILILMSIVIVCDVFVGMIMIWEHREPYLAIVVLFSALFVVASRAREMRRK